METNETTMARPEHLLRHAPGPAGWSRGWSRLDVRLPVAVVVVAALAVAVAGVRGADYPAHMLRAELWREGGFGVWNFYWYRGHATPSYSVIVPPLVSALGAFFVCAFASLIATVWFSRLTRALLPSAGTLPANVMFAVATVVNMVVGRVAFAVGLALAVLAAWSWYRGRAVATMVCALLTPLASPVAATFVAVAGLAVATSALLPSGTGTAPPDRLRRAAFPLVVTVAAAAPVLVVSVLVGSQGRYDFRGWQFLASVALMVLTSVLVRHHVVRIALVIAIGVSTVAFVVPNPLGGNFVRFAHFVVLPVAIIGAAVGRRAVMRAVSVLLAVASGWSVWFGVASALDWAGDGSTHRAFHEPLIEQVVARNADGAPLGRLEIPFTANHWEAYFTAPAVPFARGWERQMDRERNTVLYDEGLDVATYRAWLDANAVRWIAVPDVPLDDGGRPEAALLADAASGLDWLELVWRSPDWMLYEVADFTPIVDQPARLVEQTPDKIVVSTPYPAVVTIRYDYTEHLVMSSGGCLVAGPDGTIVAHLPRAGEHILQVSPGDLLRDAADAECLAVVP